MQTNTRSAIDALSVLSQSAHSPFHCCKYCEDTLKKAGFLALPKNEPISLTPGGKYYIDLYDATCIAFTVGKKVSAGKKLPKLRMITAHTDWPSFLIKPQPELTGKLWQTQYRAVWRRCIYKLAGQTARHCRQSLYKRKRRFPSGHASDRLQEAGCCHSGTCHPYESGDQQGHTA